VGFKRIEKYAVHSEKLDYEMCKILVQSPYGMILKSTKRNEYKAHTQKKIFQFKQIGRNRMGGQK
jgi:hypothetical protein